MAVELSWDDQQSNWENIHVELKIHKLKSWIIIFIGQWGKYILCLQKLIRKWNSVQVYRNVQSSIRMRKWLKYEMSLIIMGWPTYLNWEKVHAELEMHKLDE